MPHIGDLIPKAGIYTNPGVVTEKKDDGTVVIDTEPMTVNKYHRYANTTGLNEEEKNKFNGILDEIYTKENDVEKINDIQQNIDKLKVDPQNQKIVQYLRNQQAFLIRQAKNLPRTYNADASNIRGMRPTGE
jgi:hypothetical protein